MKSSQRDFTDFALLFDFHDSVCTFFIRSYTKRCYSHKQRLSYLFVYFVLVYFAGLQLAENLGWKRQNNTCISARNSTSRILVIFVAFQRDLGTKIAED